jgi:pseudouridine synthase
VLPSSSKSEGTSNSSSSGTNSEESSSAIKGVRLNKVFKAKYSRRVADSFIATGRVRINGSPVHTKGGTFVVPYKDIIELDGKVVKGWEDLVVMEAQQQQHHQHHSQLKEEEKWKEKNIQSNKNKDSVSLSLQGLSGSSSSNTDPFEYVKYYKPLGVTCTTDPKVKRNIIDEITLRNGLKPRHRIFPVGRLDKDTSGLILLTSDGRLPNASLRLSQKQPKTYIVTVDRDISEETIQKLQSGIVITTVAQRDRGVRKPFTARTKPCIVERGGLGTTTANRTVIITIMEGRNRQIRKMMEALRLNVVALKRVKFAGITLDGLKFPGDWKRLNQKEMKIIELILEPKVTGQ